MTELLEQLSPQVYRYLLWLSGQRDIAEELTQETLLRAWRHRQRLRDAEKVRGWVLRIALNLWRDRCRRHRRQDRPLDISDCTLVDQHSAATTVVQREDMTRTIAAIHTLPDRQRDVLYLHTCEELSIAEVAELLEIAPGAVKSSLSAARKQLRTRLADVYEQLAGK